MTQSIRTLITAIATAIVLFGGGAGLMAQDAPVPDPNRDPRLGKRSTRTKLRWDLVNIKYEHWDYTRKAFVEGADGYGDPQRPKKWSITPNSAHIDMVGTPGAIDYNWSRPPDSILKGKPFRLRMAVSVKGEHKSILGIMPLMDVGSWMVRFVPETGTLPALDINAPLPLQMPVPEGMPHLVGEGPNMAAVAASGEKGDRIGNETSAEVEVQLQFTAKDFAFLAVTANKCARVTYTYMETPVEGLPDRSKGVWIDRDYGYPGCNTMLKGKGLKVGETYTVSLGGVPLITRRVPQEIIDIQVTEEVTPNGGYRSYSPPSAKRPNTQGEIPPHEWIWIPTTQEAGTYYLQVECSQSGKFELPFKVLPASAEIDRGDMQDVIRLYKKKLPENTALKRAIAQPGRLRDWLGRIGSAGLAMGKINNMFFSGDAPVIGVVAGQAGYRFTAYTCGGYQGQVLGFLNYLRFNDNVYWRQLIDGVEYGPFQSEWATHHFVAVWPTHASDNPKDLARWQDTAVILDPWFEQTPVTYEIKEYWGPNAWTCFGLIQPDNWGPLGRIGATYYQGAYPITGAAQYMDPYNQSGSIFSYKDAMARKILIACPVVPLLTNSAGKRIGVLPDGKPIAELEGTFTCTEQESGGLSCMFNLPEDSYTIDLTGTGGGPVNVACASGPSIGVFDEFPIAAGEKASIKTAEETTRWVLTTPKGETVYPKPFQTGIIMLWTAVIKGAPAAMEVVLRPKGGMEGEDLTARTDARGVAAFVGIAPGEYTLLYPGAKGTDRAVEITLKPGDQSAEFDW